MKLFKLLFAIVIINAFFFSTVLVMAEDGAKKCENWVWVYPDDFDTEVVVTDSPEYNVMQEQTDVWVEAEIYDAKIGDQTLRPSAFASNGNTTGKFDEHNAYYLWNIDVPSDGRYEVVLRYASVTLNDHKGPSDRLYIISTGLQEARVNLPGTNGWGSSPYDYVDAVVKMPFNLKAGINELKIQSVNRQINIDWIGLKRVDSYVPTPKEITLILSLKNILISIIVLLIIMYGVYSGTKFYVKRSKA